MKQSRRSFLKLLGASGVMAAAGPVEASEGPHVSSDTMGCLVELSLCIGCRKCEAACNESNKLPEPKESFDDQAILDTFRRPDSEKLTVINKHEVEGHGPIYSKAQCMHCLDPACVSACIVGALLKDPMGPVAYDADKCIGCRYCMIACPFQIPAYEYHEVLTPEVVKCNFCADKLGEGETPACVSICPEEAITFGKRSDLLEIAKDRISSEPKPNRKHTPLINHIYGANEVGGTSWMYLSPVPFEKLGFLELPDKAPPRMTESIQHGIFKYFAPPAMLFGLLSASMHLLKNRGDGENDSSEEERNSSEGERE
jgi:formate dehydrogenase iron-sulfur subunit